ncbi:MAG: DUF11 domain-containing protein, partial [Chloroflexi bacterium]|nr:DUF11 domain-containing protein [Chloroflexota bacterium]
NSPQQIEVTLVVGAPTDTDGDGAPDYIEDAGPNGGDSNADLIPDKRQRNIATLPDPVEGLYAIFSAADAVPLASVSSAENPSPTDSPAGVTFPLGFYTFGAAGLTRGQAIEVAFAPEQDAGVTFNSFYRYGPTASNPSPHWYEFTFDGTTGAEVQGDQIVLHVVDGQRGDDDLAANGRILALGAPTLDLRADLALTSSQIPNVLTVVQELEYALTVTNNGPSEAINVNVSQALPADRPVRVVALAPEQGACRDDGTINCNLGNLPGGASATVRVVITTDLVGELVVSPSVRSSNLDSNDQNNALLVNINVTSPTIGLSGTALSFTTVRGNPNPRAQQLRITNAGDGSLNWFASNTCSSTGEQANLAPWLGMNPVQGSVTDGSQTLTLLASA